MFTGIVQALGIVLTTAETAAGRRVTVSLAELGGGAGEAGRIKEGDSICVSGVCLTVVKIANGAVQFDVVGETLQRTTLGKKGVQDRVNLELSLRGDGLVGGHFVQGHVDAVGRVAAVKGEAGDWRITIALDRENMLSVAPKGSVAVEGVSMTVAEVRGETFTVAVIPTTLEKTTLSALKAGDAVNVETDILARTVVHYLQSVGGQWSVVSGGKQMGLGAV